ncbi:hypothetical protein LPJ64_000125 [Coemansia asiatica]|uniref:Calcipressin n=1 Tax=Coemansia asiatica TaxID=1052880 RepID=A0A9W8CN77_9FUNG|nr:hypothetical protein LPJ64_000125 [Coemansia asiatica]KAJ2877999.1 hypothetical protein FB639_003545 [Coemansia asiatica]
MATPSASRPEATNSLVILIDSFSDEACEIIHRELESVGPLWHFAKLPSFERCLAVFAHTADAQAAMRMLNSTSISTSDSSTDTNTVRMYYSMHTDMEQTKDRFLSVPNQEKLWLISPPGSPPINWRQTREEPPNAVHLDHRIHAALKELSLGQYTLNPADIPDYDSADEDVSAELGSFTLGPSALSDDSARPEIAAGGIDDSSASDDDCADAGRSAASKAGNITPTILIQNYDHVVNGSSAPSSSSLLLSGSEQGHRRPRLASRPPTHGAMTPHKYTSTARPPL